MRQKPVAADRFARAALRDVARNKGVIVLPRSTKGLWYLNHLSPALVERITRSMARTVNKDLIRPRGDHRTTAGKPPTVQ